MGVARQENVLIPHTFESNQAREQASEFWRRILSDDQLCDCDNLQKLLAGCEIIAAVDSVDLLAA
jgi:hypothetical protein